MRVIYYITLLRNFLFIFYRDNYSRWTKFENKCAAMSKGYVPINIVYFSIGANEIARAKKNDDDVTSLHFSDLIRVDRGGPRNNTHRRLVEQLSPSGSAWPFRIIDHA